MLIKLDEAIKLVEELPIGGGTLSSWINANESPMGATRRHIAEALRALPVSDGWEEIATAPRQVWLLCWGPDAGSGVAKYPFNIIGDEWPDYTHWRPLPAPPTIE